MEKGVCRVPSDREKETWSTASWARNEVPGELSSPFPPLVWALPVPAQQELMACLISMRLKGVRRY